MRQWLVLALALLMAGCTSAGGTSIATKAGGEALRVVQEHSRSFNRRDLGGMMAGVSPEVEWYSVDGENIALELRGRDALRDAMADYFKATPSFRSEIESAVVSGAYVSVCERASWQSASGPRTQTAIAVFEVRDDLIRRVWYYPAER